jgi:hypothetical protein
MIEKKDLDRLAKAFRHLSKARKQIRRARPYSGWGQLLDEAEASIRSVEDALVDSMVKLQREGES